MTVKQNEMLSALVDGQLDLAELDNVLALLDTDEQARKDFLRYQYASDVMHGYSRGAQPVDLAKRMTAQLAAEPVHKTTRAKAKVLAFPKLAWKQMASLAVAASIGALAVVGVMNHQSTVGPTMSPVAMNTPAEQAKTTQVAASGNRWTVGEPAVEDKLNGYLVDHNEYSGASGLFSYARVVSYGEEQ